MCTYLCISSSLMISSPPVLLGLIIFRENEIGDFCWWSASTTLIVIRWWNVYEHVHKIAANMYIYSSAVTVMIVYTSVKFTGCSYPILGWWCSNTEMVVIARERVKENVCGGEWRRMGGRDNVRSLLGVDEHSRSWCLTATFGHIMHLPAVHGGVHSTHKHKNINTDDTGSHWR